MTRDGLGRRFCKSMLVRDLNYKKEGGSHGRTWEESIPKKRTINVSLRKAREGSRV